jgi:hypothetical protein
MPGTGLELCPVAYFCIICVDALVSTCIFVHKVFIFSLP